ncbi:hypothetical protein CONCODRAFT_36004 [Conidiobolus coronatus NRRL 28638]|uniref:Indoleamine 2,3-dioxygenase n=1 Tax=Conidiobolus coronatus (strain ATCC 28846 / CBS 209.66 / NRRL 28638) TaxID=796925 RepID=A0A137PE52_CONC2|nr:hypothetical protein CONCODRAFT_36004 [Conidiobolus coronatus NRRL 28638]|eukprot:KXN73283.1 hypothetical protein CONCODRAFT_36004 [Conidiobolus coronatus NRRL 28638]
MPQSEFFVSPKNGFLPRQDPLKELPAQFDKLEDLLQRMPLRLKDGSPGLLWKGEFGDAVKSELPFYDVSGVEDPRLLAALYRDYTFAASSYLLEPCDIQYRNQGEYGLGRQVLPKSIAVPLSIVADKIGAKPFMEYAMCYSLYNYKRENPRDEMPNYKELSLIRGFAMTPDEHGFILVHVAMVAHSGNLIKYSLDTLKAVHENDRQKFDTAIKGYLDTMEQVNQVMETMWGRSQPEQYLNFRTFIMGSKNQPMFPNGVIYEGTPDEATPRFYRGESGANDSMIPLSDNLFQVTASLPDNPLTRVLKDFRTYRPVNHHHYLNYVQEQADTVGVRQFAEKDPNSLALYLGNLDQIRAFRHRHWLFTKEYIIKRTTHPVATGGSPIVTWLPNQLASVMTIMQDSGSKLDVTKCNTENRKLAEDVLARAETQLRVLKREVKELQEKFPNQEKLAVV